MRLFFALWPPPEAAHALGIWAGEVAKDAVGRATRSETIHLTLAFLGDADPAKAAAAARVVRAQSFDLPIDGAKYWPHNRIIWVGPREMPGELRDLVAGLHSSLEREGFALEKRPFAAHITLVRKAGRASSIPTLPAVSWPAEEFVLVCSRLSSQGSRYEIIDRFPLA